MLRKAETLQEESPLNKLIQTSSVSGIELAKSLATFVGLAVARTGSLLWERYGRRKALQLTLVPATTLRKVDCSVISLLPL